MKIMLDAGHGYETAGKRSPDGMREYEFNRSVAEYLGEFLKKRKGVSISHAHSDLEDVPLSRRTSLANSLDVDCYISIHANAFGLGSWHSANGIETYIHTSRPLEAWKLAQAVQEKLVEATTLRDRGVKNADFFVLRETRMTAILVECGFMTNKAEAALLKTDAFRKRCAQAIGEAIAEFYGLRESGISEMPDSLFVVQAGAFGTREKAERLAVQLREEGFGAYVYRRGV
ncbi:MAG TPA: N-acetylmuramoyl-L-alanine amidase [Bacillaceae bacterium]